MSGSDFFERPILNSPYRYPDRHWELDEDGQPTHQMIPARRRAEFITPIPKPRGRKDQATIQFDDPKGLSTDEHRYHAALINGVREEVNRYPGVFEAIFEASGATLVWMSRLSAARLSAVLTRYA